MTALTIARLQPVNVFEIRNQVVDRYADYMRSFVRIKDERIGAYVDERLSQGRLWPEPLVQLSPSFASGGSIDDLVKQGTLVKGCASIFRRGKTVDFPHGDTLRLHQHQAEGLRAAQEGASYVLTTGTGSGKSLAYFVPIVDRILRDGPGQGIKAIVVYPMNALANSQEEELRKFLGDDLSRSPVTVGMYTGQNDTVTRERIKTTPPDILLTNYVMLELIMTRQSDLVLIDRHAQNLQFLVLDELHTYRGRQGADVAMLVRRVQERIENPDMQCVGTSATMSSAPNLDRRRLEIASVASRLFGKPVLPRHVIGETLEWTTSETPPDRAELIESITNGQYPKNERDFRRFPLAIWIEHHFGLRYEAGSDVLARQEPKTVVQGAETLARQTGLEAPQCQHALERTLLRGYEIAGEQHGRSLFGFRLHQFISRGDTVYSTIEVEAAKRHLTLTAQVFAPATEGEGDRRLFPMAFCRECGEGVFPVHWLGALQAPGALGERELKDRADRDDSERRSGYLWFDVRPDGPFELTDAFLPEDWFEESKQGTRLKSSRRKTAPVPVAVTVEGGIEALEEGPSAAWFIFAPLAFCPGCGHVWGSQGGDFPKLAELATEGRATATTILSLATVQALRQATGLQSEAMKLLSFTDNRQDASLQAGHFNDFVQTSTLRGAILAAVRIAGPAGLRVDEIAESVFRALNLDFKEYAQNPGLAERRQSVVQIALQDLLGYRILQDVRRGWRVNAPNLEQTGQLSIEFDQLDDFCEEDAAWTGSHPLLESASPQVRRAVCLLVLEFFRRELAIASEYLDVQRVRGFINRAQSHLKPDFTWMLADEDVAAAPQVAVGLKATGKRKDDPTGLTPRSKVGLELNKPSSWQGQLEAKLPMAERVALLRGLCEAMASEGLLVHQGETRTGDPLYQVQSSVMRWRRAPSDILPEADGAGGAPVATRQTNRFFRDFYDQVASSLAGANHAWSLSRLEAREHTAQVPSDVRETREDRFKTAEISVLYCSPTMELGVDIAQLNAVNMRNVPPTPANYAQRSGRAGRSGQPALIVTYCTSHSPHDQYYFTRRAAMVAGVVEPPQIDLANEDLVSSHIHAIWLAETGQSLGHTLADILDLDDRDRLKLKPEVQYAIDQSHVQSNSRRRAQQVLAAIQPELAGAAWFTDRWLDDLLGNARFDFDRACDRWRNLYRSALAQKDENNERKGNRSLSSRDQQSATSLWNEAVRQLDLLSGSSHDGSGFPRGISSDFYSYRYFASEGFLPGYNFPRLPLTAYLPEGKDASGRGRNNQEFVSRGRFVAISEFGPGNHIYYEGSRYQIDRVIMPPRQEGGGVTTTARICGVCGYGYFGDHRGIEICDLCQAPLAGSEIYVPDLFRMQNVNTRRIDRITSDEEERLRQGYELQTAFHFKSTSSGSDFTTSQLAGGDKPLADLTYAPAATLWRINRGWRRRKNKDELGFRIDLGSGKWSQRDLSKQNDVDDDSEPGVLPDDHVTMSRVVPYVQDTRNALLLVPASIAEQDQLVSLGYALKRGIEAEFQLETNELALEFMPSNDQPTRLLFYESAEGGAGVLTRVATEPLALRRVAKRALALCHYDENLRDLGRAAELTGDDSESADSCIAACYNCLLGYHNQRHHLLLDRRLLPDLLQEWTLAETHAGSGGADRQSALETLLARCESQLERDFLNWLNEHGHRLPDRAQPYFEGYGARPDFSFANRGAIAVLYVDGPYHEFPDRARRDAETTTRLESEGLRVIRVTSREKWSSQLANWAHIVGEGTSEGTRRQ